MQKTRIVHCPVCQRKFSTIQAGRKYCSQECAWTEKSKRKYPKNIGCPHNGGLLCYKRECESCGWSPEVEAQRREKLLGRV